MPPAEMYFIAWKGRRDGPFSLDQLAALLQKGDIGLLHRVETTAGTMPLRQLLLASDPVRFAALAAPSASGSRPLPEPFTPGKPPAAFASPAPAGSSPPTSPAASSTPGSPSSLANPFGLTPAHPPAGLSHPAPSAHSPEAHPPFPPRETESPRHEPPATPDALRAYTVCGLTFLFPPLAWYALQLANQLAAHPATRPNAQLLRYLTYALAPAGLLFWLLLWHEW